MMLAFGVTWRESLFPRTYLIELTKRSLVLAHNLTENLGNKLSSHCHHSEIYFHHNDQLPQTLDYKKIIVFNRFKMKIKTNKIIAT